MAKYANFSQEDIDEFPLLIAFHTVNFYLGIGCTIVNCVLLLVFLTSKLFRSKYKVLISLAVADWLNTIAIILMGQNRVQLYSTAYETHHYPLRTSWQCAIEPWLTVKLIGDLWPPIIHIIMGFERLISIMAPVWYRKKIESSPKMVIGISLSFVIASTVTGFGIAWAKDSEGYVKYYCGRKEAFSKGFGTFVYITNVFGYVFGFCLNCAAYLKAQILKKSKNAIVHLRRIRYYLMISFFSTVLVSIPNTISLFSSWIKDVNNAIAKPAVWATAINSAINLFVYMLLNPEFRQRILRLGHIRVKISVNPPPNVVHNAVTVPTRVMRSPLLSVCCYVCFAVSISAVLSQRLLEPERAKRALVDGNSAVPGEVELPKHGIAEDVHRPGTPPSSAFGNAATEDNSAEIVFKVGKNIVPYAKFKKALLRNLWNTDRVKVMVDGNSQHEAVLNSLMASPMVSTKTESKRGAIKGALTETVTPETSTEPTVTKKPTIATTQAAEFTPHVVTILQPNVPVPIKIRKVKFRPISERFRTLATLPSEETTPPTTASSSEEKETLATAAIKSSKSPDLSAEDSPSPTVDPTTLETLATSHAEKSTSHKVVSTTTTTPETGTLPASVVKTTTLEPADETEAIFRRDVTESPLTATTEELPELTTKSDVVFRRTGMIGEHIYSSLPDKFFVGRNYVPKELYARQARKDLAEKKLKEQQKKQKEQQKQEPREQHDQEVQQQAQEEQQQPQPEQHGKEAEKQESADIGHPTELQHLESQPQLPEKKEEAYSEFPKAARKVSDLPLHPEGSLKIGDGQNLIKQKPDVTKAGDNFVHNNRLLERTTETIAEIHSTVPSTSTMSPSTSSETEANRTIKTDSKSSSIQTPSSRLPTAIPQSILFHRQSRIQYLNITPAPRHPNRKNRLNGKGHHFLLRSGQLARAKFITSVRRLVTFTKQHHH